MLAFNTPKQLSIELTEPIVYLRGTPCDSITNILRGDIVVTLTKPCVITSIELKFIGKCRTLWPEGIGPYSRRTYEDKIILHQTIPILLTNSTNCVPASSLHLDVGVHRWPFEIMIPNSLTETISCDLGMVEYRLYAAVQRTGTLVMNLHARRDIIVLRVPDHLALDAAPESSMTVIRESEWCDWSLTIEHIPVTAGRPLCVVGRVVATKKGMRIESLTVTISEKRTICASEVRASRVEEKRLRLVCPDAHKSDRIGVELDETGGVWEERAAFDTPNCKDKLHHTTLYPNILVKHWVRVALTVSMIEEEPESGGSGKKGKNIKKEKRSYREYLLDSPIQILDCRCVDDFIALPVYSAVMGQITPEGFRCPCGDEYKNIKQKGLSSKDFEYVAVGDREAPPPPNYEDVMGPWNSADEGETGVWKNIEQDP